MFEIVIDTSELDAFAKDLAETPGLFQKFGEDAMYQAVANGKDICAEYPDRGDPHLHGSNPAPFYSPKQRMFVMAGIKTGTLIVPYPRTGQHRETWQTDVESEPEVITGHISSTDPRSGDHNNTNGYDLSVLLHGVGADQATMFREAGSWQDIDVLGNQVEESIQPYFDTAIENLVSILKG